MLLTSVNKAKGDGAGQNELFGLPNADDRRLRLSSIAILPLDSRPSDNNGNQVA